MDYGLLGGLAEGLRQGWGSYQDAKRYNDERALKERQSKAQEAEVAGKLIDTLGYLPKGFVSPETEEAFKFNNGQSQEQPSGLVPQTQEPQAQGLMNPRDNSGFLTQQPGTPFIPKHVREGELHAAEMSKSAKPGYRFQYNPESRGFKEVKIPRTEEQEIELEQKKRNLEKTKKELNKGDNAYNVLPREKQKILDDLAGAAGNKQVISNTLKADYEKLNDPKIADDQKLAYARSMIKTLNSKEGKDAVGKEEADRLAAFLKYHIGNVTEPGPFVGRAPISEFAKQVANTISSLDESTQLNMDQIQKLYGKDGIGVRPVPQAAGRGLMKSYPSTASQSHKPGDIVNVKGQGRFRVGADGDSLEPVR